MKRAFTIIAVFAAASASAFAEERLDLRRDAIVKAVEKAAPAVVNISTERVVQRGFFFGDDNPFNDPLFDEFTRRFSRPEIATSLGSGGIFSPDGYIFTNAHVVNRASKIMVTFADGSQHSADLVNVDVASDLAVIKVSVGKPLPVLVFGRSDDLMVGEKAIAVGNPFGLSSSVTEGVISALHRDVVAEGRVLFKDILQTDALINPGNSGGPLLNIFGEVIGVTTAMRADAQGIGFAIPVDRARRSIGGLLDYRKGRRMSFGFDLEEKYVDSSPAVRLVVKSVDAAGPADKAGCKAGDVILAVNGRQVSGVVDFMVAILSYREGEVKLSCSRGSRDVVLAVTPVTIPKPDPIKIARDLLGLGVQQMERALAPDVGVDIDKGILISDVRKDSPAAGAGVMRSDIILQVNDALTADLESFALALESAAGGNKVYLVILRRKGSRIYQGPVEITVRR